MSSRRDVEAQRERERKEERERRMQPAPSRPLASTTSRMHEYFVPKDGIDREVITADICRYLGNDALVRPGVYENPSTGQTQQGYFIKAYRNLTGAMIEDLKLDSERWEAERRAAPLGRPINGTSLRDSGGHRTSNAQPAPSYLQSRTHESRQYYGHNEASLPPPQGFSSMGPPQDRYSNEPQYPSSQPPSQGYTQPVSSYDPRPPQSGGFPIHNEPPRDYYVSAGTHYVNDRNPSGRIAVTQGDSVPRGGDVYMHGGPAPQYQPQDGRYSQFQQQIPVSSAPPFSSQSDPYYRGPPQDYQDSAMSGYSDSRPIFSDQGSYNSPGPGSSAPSNPTISTSANSSSRREHRSDDRRRDDRNDRHHRPR